MHRFRPSPALLISLLALFFALGGTAFAIGSKTAPAQPRCATGAVRGIAVVTGARIDLSTLTSNYTSDSSLFDNRWSCTGGQIQVRKAPGAQAAIDVKFDGNPATVAIVSSAANGVPNAGSASERQPDGSFRIAMGGSNATPGPWEPEWNIPFVIVLF
jgi:hypothetical protein